MQLIKEVAARPRAQKAPSVGFADISPCQGESALRRRRFFDRLNKSLGVRLRGILQFTLTT